MSTILEVDDVGGCEDCPLSKERENIVGDAVTFCGGLDGFEERDVPGAGNVKPTWCPLKSGDVVVRLKGGE